LYDPVIDGRGIVQLDKKSEAHPSVINFGKSETEKGLGTYCPLAGLKPKLPRWKETP
jgi:hypothetical protein